ncbi:MAG: Gfo/Idh/MocA family protein, partial [Planctomycetota bacterium]
MSRQKKVSRRRLLKDVTAVAAGVISFPCIVPSSVVGKSVVTPSNRIAMGFIGMGIQGTGLMQAFLGHKDVQVVAVCDVSESQRLKAKDIVDKYYGSNSCLTYNDFREICKQDDIDAVCVATPDHWHIPVSLEAARAGKDMYTEKALGL